jgi:hypothetical protein
MDGAQRLEVPGGPPGTAYAPGTGAEATVVGRDRWEQMHRLRAKGRSISQIARATGVDRKTARTCLTLVEWRLSSRSNTLADPAGSSIARAPGSSSIGGYACATRVESTFIAPSSRLVGWRPRTWCRS